MSKRASILVLCVLLVGVHPARAAAPLQPDARQEARQLYELGKSEFARGDFRSALAEFQRSYSLSDAAPLLYNIAVCEQQLGDNAHAIQHLRAYLARVPSSEDRSAAEQLLVELGVAADDPEAHVVPPAPTVQAQKPEVTTPPVAPLVAAAPPPKKSVAHRWWFWTALGGGVIAVGLGVGLGVGLSRRDSFGATLGAIDLRPAK